MTDIDREIQVKKAEIAELNKMLCNAKQDLKRLEKRKEGELNGSDTKHQLT